MTARSTDVAAVVERLLALPRAQQVEAALVELDRLDAAAAHAAEAWNSRFHPDSLFAAWTATSIASGVHDLLAERIRPVVQREGFVAVEVGAGDGGTWQRVWTGAEQGVLVVVDPVAEAVERLARTVPEGVRVERRVGGIEEVELPPADLVVCSMTLHHRAGRDAAERARHGLTGPGKQEILEGFRRAVRPRDGVALLVEADVDCELHLPAGDPVLRDNLFDSYVRRCARAIVADIRSTPEAPIVDAWQVLLHRWFLAQIRMADVPLVERDVYELTVAQWIPLFAAAGLAVAHAPADDWSLFRLYTAT